MSNYTTSTFQDALDVIETLPDEQQETIVDIIRRRIVEGGKFSLIIFKKPGKNIRKVR